MSVIKQFHRLAFILSLTFYLLNFAGFEQALRAQDTDLTTLNPYDRARWLSQYTESARDTEGWIFVGFGGLSLGTGIALHLLAMNKNDKEVKRGLHIGGGVLDALSVGLGSWGAYLLSTNETITNELETLENVSKQNPKRLERGSELLLESYANQERFWRYTSAVGGIVLGLGAGIPPFFTKSSADVKVSSAIMGLGGITYGLLRFLFRTKAEDFWETYKRDRSAMKESQKSSNWKIEPVLVNLDQPQYGFNLKLSF